MTFLNKNAILLTILIAINKSTSNRNIFINRVCNRAALFCDFVYRKSHAAAIEARCGYELRSAATSYRRHGLLKGRQSDVSHDAGGFATCFRAMRRCGRHLHTARSFHARKPRLCFRQANNHQHHYHRDNKLILHLLLQVL